MDADLAQPFTLVADIGLSAVNNALSHASLTLLRLRAEWDVRITSQLRDKVILPPPIC